VDSWSICEPILKSCSKSHIWQIKLTPPAYSHITVLLVFSLKFSLPDCRRGEFTVIWKTWMVDSGTGKCLGWLYALLLLVLCSSANVHNVEPAQSLQAGFWGFTSALPQFWTITFPTSPSPPPTQCNHPCTTSHVQPAKFFYLIWQELLLSYLAGTSSILFGGNFCEQQLVLGKLTKAVKWPSFCVSFICMLTFLGWL